MLLVVYDEKVIPEKEIAYSFIVSKKIRYRLSIWLVLGAIFNLFFTTVR